MEIKLHFQTKKTAKGLQFGVIQKIFLGLLLLMSCGVMGQITEGFETGLSSAGYSTSQTLSSGTWTGLESLLRSTNARSGNYSCQIKSGTANFVATPSLNTCGVVTFWFRGGTPTVRKTVAGVTTNLTATAGTVSGSYTQYSVTVNDASNAVVISIYNSASTSYLDDFSSTSYSATPCSGTPNPGNTVAATNPVVTGGTTVLSLQNTTSGSGVSYQWQSSTTSASTGFTNISGATSATYTATVSTKTWFKCIVTCSGSSTTSNATQVDISYCVPTYSSGPGTIDNIANVSLGTLNNSSGSSVSPYYTFYNTATIPDLTQSSPAIVSVTYGSDSAQFGAVWIDFNQNGIFEASEGLVSTNAGANGTSLFNFTVPATAVIGTTRMRVRGGNDSALTTSQACGASSSGFGETEDYIVNIVAPSATPVLAITGNTNNGSSCPLVAATAQIYTITNTGTSAATGITVSSSDPQFVISGLSSATIAGSGGTATYTVTFTPSSAGPKTATITVASATSGSNSPTSNLTGTGTATVSPVAVTGAATAISAYAATLNATGGTTFGVCPNTTQKGFVYSQTSVNNDPTHLGTGVTTTPVTPIGATLTAYNSNISGLIAGTSYSYKAYLFDGTNYTYGSMQTFTTSVPPANDLCANAQVLAVNAAATSGTFVNSNFETPFTSGKDVWYKMTPLCNGRFTIDLVATAGQPQIYLYDVCGNTVALQNTTGTGTTKQLTTSALSQNTDYYIRVLAGNIAAESATFTIAVNNLIAIVSQPASQTVAIGSPASFGVSTPANQTGRQWQVSTDNGATWTDVAGATGSPYATPAATISMNGYQYRAVISNGTCNVIISNAATLTVTACTSNPSSNDGSGITSVTMGATTFAVSDVTYFNYTGSVPTLNQGALNTSSITFATGFTYDTHIWIDFNDDGVFDTATEKVYTGMSVATNPTVLNTSFALTATATLGNHRMRIGTADSGQSPPNPCYSGGFGVTIDLMVNIVVPPPPTTYTWTGATNTSWGTATNWSPNGIPGANDSVIISSPGTNGLIINGTQTVTNFTLNGTGNFTMNASGVLTINGNVTYGGTATATLNCASQVNITSAASQLIPPLTYGNLNALGGNRVFSPTGIIKICSAFSVNPAIYTYTIAGSTVEYISPSTGWSMVPFTYNNLTFSGTGSFTLMDGSMNVNGNFLQSNGVVEIGYFDDARLNVVGNMQISGGEMNLEYADNAEILVGGSFTQTSGELYLTAYESTVMNVGGNYSLSNDAFVDIMNGDATVGITGNFSASGDSEFYLTTLNTSTLNISGNMSLTGNSLFDMNYSGGTGTVNLYGDLLVSANGDLTASETTTANTQFYFVGAGDGLTPATTQNVNIAGGAADRTSNIQFYVDSGAYVQLATNNFDLGNKSRVIVQSGGTFDFGFNGTTPLNVLSSGTATHFTSQNGSTLKITSPDGITMTAGLGNVQVPPTNRTYNQTANFHYIGKQNQVTGDALSSGSTVKNVFVNLLNNATELRLSNKVGITDGGKLEIQKGTLIAEEVGTDDRDFYGTGHLVMSDGEYRISTITGNPASEFLPQLSKYASYALTGGIVHLNGSNANQVLSGIPIYKKLTFSGTNTLGANDKKISKAVQVDEELYIKEAAILNSENKGITGAADVKMDSGRWQNSVISSTQPLLTGEYLLDGGTMEFYGSGPTSNQTFRGDIVYNNIDVKATTQNVNYGSLNEFYNVKASESFSLKGNLTVHAPAVFKISSTHHVGGAGSIYVSSGATLLYGSEDGITTGSTGAVRVTGTRSFPIDASYGFVGAGDMVTGNALPTNVENLYVAKASGTLNVSLSGNVTAKNKMYFLNGNIITGSNNFQLGTDAVNKGTLEYTGGFVKGAMTRWFGGANSGDATALFPLGTIDNKTRAARVEFASTTTPGAITASVQNTAMGIAGIAALAPIPTSGLCPAFSVFNTEDFYWNLTPAGISGSYKARFSKEQLTGESICNVTLLNRTATDWTAPGTDPDVTALVGVITAMRSGLTTFSDFGFGNRKCGETKTWTGTWSGGTAPTITNKVVFAANYDSATQGGNVSACECEIQTGVTVTMAGGTTAHNMEIYGKLEGSGTLKLENNASLIQYDDNVSNSGSLDMTRNTQPSFRYDYTYWSSPVASQGLHALSPATFFDKYFSWNAGLQEWYLHQRPTPWNPAATPLPEDVMRPGKGYIIRAPQTFPVEAAGATPQIFAAEFKGVPNNGVVSIPVAGGTDKYNLIGNPYASAISADAFLQNAANVGTVEGTLYFWTHNTPIAQSGGTGMYSYSAADYAVYNGVGATSTVPGANPGGPNNNPNVPNGNIASGQSFFIKGSATGGSVKFNNSMRLKGNNNQFFRYAAAEALPQPELEKHRIWLNLSNETNGFSQSLIGYVENATNGYDRNFDGELLGGGSVSLYSLLEGDKMAIQGKTLPFDQNDQVPMGFKATAAGNLKVSLDHFDGLFSGQNIYLEDKALDIIHDLKAAPYTFTTTAGTFNERFVVRYTNESLGTGEHSMDANGVIVAVKDKVIKVISAKENIQSIAVFDLLGRAIYENNQVNALSFSTEEIAAQEQVLIVKIVLENNAKADRKIIFK